MAQVRSLGGDLVGDLQIQFHAGFSCNSGQMQHSIRGAAQRHIYRQCILECFRCHNVSGTDIFLYQFHDLHAGMFCQTDTLGIYGRNRTVTAKSHTNGFGQTDCEEYQTEVADMIGISQAQVSRLEKNALKAMRGYLTA